MSDESPTKTEGEPHDRLTGIANDALKAVEDHGLKVIVFVSDDERSGIGIGGYEDPNTAPLVDLFMHLQAMFEAQGKGLMFAPITAASPDRN